MQSVIMAAMGIALVAVLVVGGIVLVLRLEKKRREAFRALAAEEGWSFSAKPDGALLGRLQGFKLFEKGRSQKMRNVITAESDVANVSVFDYTYTTGSGDNKSRHTHSVVAVESDSLDIPRFSIRPEHLFDHIGAALGFQDIDFAEHREFSKKFVLKGSDEEAIRAFFDRGLLDFFAQQKPIYVEGASVRLIFYRRGKKRPEELRNYMKEGFGVYAAFAKRLGRG